MKYSGFYKNVLISDVVACFIAIILVIRFTPAHAYALVTASVITTFNTAIGFYFIQKYINATAEQFNSYIYGSTFGRLLGMMIVIGFVLLFSNFPQITFVLSLFVSYIYKSVLEIIFIHKNSTQRHEKS